MAAGDEEGLAGDPARILGGKKDCDGTDVVGLTDAAQRRLRFHGFLKIRSGDAGGMKAVAQAHEGTAGVYGAVLAERMIRKGDPVELLD